MYDAFPKLHLICTYSVVYIYVKKKKNYIDELTIVLGIHGFHTADFI